MTNQVDRISVVYTTDDRYWMPLYVSLFSLVKVNRKTLFTFYIICEKEDAAFVEYVEQLRKRFNFEIIFIRVDDSFFSKFPVIGYFTSANYYRLLIGTLLPNSLNRIYYIDCDTIVRKPLTQLFECNLDGVVLGAVVDPSPEACERLGVSPYFNSGVLAINLDLWRTEQIERKALTFLEAHPEKIQLVDQDVLNAVLVDRWVPLPIELNFQTVYCKTYLRETAAIKMGLAMTSHHGRPGIFVADPALVHYTTEEKPWFYMSRHPYKADFWKILRRTPYRKYREPDRTWDNFKDPLLHQARRFKRRWVLEPIGATIRKVRAVLLPTVKIGR